jgi:N-acetylmuramoyl-L-alanine amidase
MRENCVIRPWVTMLIALIAACSLVAAAHTPDAGAQQQPPPSSGKTIVLDPGHGGNDWGARYVDPATKIDIKEKDQVLDVAKRLRALLVADGADVVMTREGDRELSNTQRADIANSVPGANVLISIHMNGSTNPATDYTTTLFGNWRKDKALAYAVFGDPKATSLYGLVSLRAARGTGNIASRSPYSYASGVLIKSNMPATIAETVFITNPDEARLLSDGSGARQQEIAEKLRQGVRKYLVGTP